MRCFLIDDAILSPVVSNIEALCSVASPLEQSLYFTGGVGLASGWQAYHRE